VVQDATSMDVRAMPRRQTRAFAVRALELAAAVLLLAVAAAAARDFRVDAVREFRFAWATWSAAVALAFAAGAVLSVVVTLPILRAVVIPVVAFAALVLVHLPIVLMGGGVLDHWTALATSSFVDRTGPQLLAAVVAGAGVARLVSAAGASARRRGRQVVQ
jgi:hypothetical protein